MNIALILSGGTGSRMGLDVPKQYISVAGRPVLLYSLETILADEYIDAVQIVADAAWQEQIRVWIAGWEVNMGLDGASAREAVNTREKFRGFSVPGENRQLSILNGLRDIRRYAPDGAFVFIHDAARPMLSHKQIRDCLTAAEGHDGVLPVLPMKDTVYYRDDSNSVSLLERERIFAGQAPEVFCLGSYLDANEKLLPDRILKVNGSTEPAVLAGLDVVTIPGDEKNFKITTKEDLERFRQMADRFGPQ